MHHNHSTFEIRHSLGIRHSSFRGVIAILTTALLLSASPLPARTLLKNICRVKGQEENTLQGLGLVVGLKGSGDSANSAPTIRALAQMIQLMGAPIAKQAQLELKEDVKNVALVTVTATIPGIGARQGDMLDCVVSSTGGAKSLAGGQLFITALRSSRIGDERVFAVAQGLIHLDDPKSTPPTTGKVFRGCRVEQDIFNPFVKDGKITLVLNSNHADFQVAQDVVDLINSSLGGIQPRYDMAHAIDQENIVVLIPPQYKEKPVLFVSQVLGLQMLDPQTEARVVINERAGTIVFGGDVEIGAVVVNHKNMVVDTTGSGPASDQTPPPPASRFVGMETGPAPSTKLKALVDTLNALKVPTADVIDIIKGLDRNGKLHGQLIIE